MDWNQAREILDAILKETNIKTLNISEDKVVVEFGESFNSNKIKRTYVSKEEDGRRSFSFSRKKVKDPRWIQIMDSLHITPKEWLDRNYPDIDYCDLKNFMYYHKDMSLRQCCERLNQE